MTTLISNRTSYLYAMPSFASGFARALDLFGTFDEYVEAVLPAEADELAIANDWMAVGDDMRHVFEAHARK